MHNGEDKLVGHPVQIVALNDDHTFTLKLEELERITSRKDVKDKPVVIISVAGAFRKGKSFLLSYVVRYLLSKVNQKPYQGVLI
jgi:atlastin